MLKQEKDSPVRVYTGKIDGRRDATEQGEQESRIGRCFLTRAMRINLCHLLASYTAYTYSAPRSRFPLLKGKPCSRSQVKSLRGSGERNTNSSNSRSLLCINVAIHMA